MWFAMREGPVMGKIFRFSLGFLLIGIGGLLKTLALFGESQEGTTGFGKEGISYDEDAKPRGAFSGERFLDRW
jgi:hypothetical protein